MADLVQRVSIIRRDSVDLLKECADTLNVVMAAGERQRLAAGKDPNGWEREPALERLRHVWFHILRAYEKQNPYTLTHDTALMDLEHALVGIAMLLVNAKRDPEKLTEVIEE